VTALRNVLVTHADEPLGRRVVKLLYHDDRIGAILAVGSGRPPRPFDRFLRSSGGRLHYHRADLAKHRPVAELFGSRALRKAQIDTVVHLPRHAAVGPDERPLVAGVSERTAEARLVLQHCLEAGSIRNLVALGSAFVYRLAPGNANRLTEDSELELDPAVPAEIRSWIDCDMILHGEIHNDRLRVALLRAPTVVASGGYVFLNPALSAGGAGWLRPLGFDPLCALISDKDVAHAVRLAVRSRAAGIFNVSGREAVPLSVLARWTRRRSLPLPGTLLSLAARAAQLVGGEGVRTAFEGPHLYYGYTLDTGRAERELGFQPSYRIGLSRAGDGSFRLETASA
jgi:UDP-glucose 4-epimerase